MSKSVTVAVTGFKMSKSVIVAVTGSKMSKKRDRCRNRV